MRKGIKYILLISSISVIMGAIIIFLAFKFGLTVDASGKSVTNEYVFTDMVKDISLDISTTNIEFKKSEESKLKIISKEKTKIYCDFKIEDETLFIEQHDTREWYEKIMNFRIIRNKVTVYLPYDSFNNFVCDSSTGNIKFNDSFSFNDITIDLSTGNVLLNDLNCNNLTVDSSTGNVKLNNVIVANKTKIDTSTGNITLDNCDSDYYKLSASTGNIKCTNLKTLKKVDAKASTGNVSVNKQSSLDIEPNLIARTSTGNIKIHFI